METVSLIKMDYNEVDDLINKHFFPDKVGHFECIASDEWCNYESHEMDLDGILEDYDEEDIQERKYSYMTCTYLNKLVQMGVIPKGEYLIEVFW